MSRKRSSDSVPDADDALTEALLNQIAARIVETPRAHGARGGKEWAREVGRIAFEGLFQADRRAWRSHGRKSLSIHGLARRLRGRRCLGHDSLDRWIGVYRLLQRTPEFLSLDELTLTHLLVVLPLPPTDQAAVLRLAATRGLSVAVLKAMVVARPSARPRVRGLRRVVSIERAPADDSESTAAEGAADLRRRPSTTRRAR